MFSLLLSNRKMDIDEIRRANICALEREAGSTTEAAERVGMTTSQFSNYKNGAKEAKTGKARGMRKETAWRFEDGFNKPRGWLDTPHTDNDISGRRGTHHTRLLVQRVCEIAETIDDTGLRNLIDIAECLARNHPQAQANAA